MANKKQVNSIKLEAKTKFWQNPWFTIVGWLGIPSIIIAVVLFAMSQEQSELVYRVNPTRTVVVASGKASELDVYYRGSKLGDVDVTAVQIALWNKGNKPIREEDILEDIVISSFPEVPIMEISLNKISRETIQFALKTNEEELASGKVPVGWRILEKNDGASVQIIYKGKSDVDFKVSGEIVGKNRIPEALKPINTLWQLASSMIAGIASGLAFTGFIWFKDNRILRAILIGLGVLIFFGMIAINFFITRQTIPPFGF